MRRWPALLDIVSYLIGKSKGASNVTIDGDGVTYTDAHNDGNIVITEVSE